MDGAAEHSSRNTAGRKRDNPSDDELSQREDCLDGKRRRLQLGTIEGLSTRPRETKFLEFHLKVLKSLYDVIPSQNDTDNGGRRIVDDDGGDVPVSDLVWALSDSFLGQRAGLLRAKRETSRRRAIQEEAAETMEERQRQEADAQSGGAAASSHPDLTASSPFSPRWLRQHSPILSNGDGYRRFTNPPAAPDVMGPPGGSSFRVMACLLGRRHHAVRCHYEKLTAPYRPLLENTEERINVLQQKLADQRDRLLERDRKITSDLLSVNVYASTQSQQENVSQQLREQRERSESERSQMAQIETKIRLWKLLLSDLKDVVA